MIRNFSYRAGRLQGCLQTILTTDLTAYLFILVAIYFGIAAAFSFCLNSFLPDGVDLKWLRAMDGVTLIVGFVYYIWIKDAMDGYTAASSMYRDLLNKITTFTEHYAAIHRNYTAMNTIKDVRDASVALIYKGYRLFDSGVDDDDEVEDDTRTDARSMSLTSVDIINIASRKKGDERSIYFVMRDLIMAINARVSEGEESGAISGSARAVLSDNLNRLTLMVESIDTAANVPSPSIFKTHILFTLFVYFGLWLPFYFWGSIGTEGTLFIYPLTMFILTGIPLYRTWLGDPFDQTRPIHLIDYDIWKEEFKDRIDRSFSLLTPDGEREHNHGFRNRNKAYEPKFITPSVDNMMENFNYA